MIRKILRSTIDLILPPLCYGCKGRVIDPRNLCASCWSHLSFLGDPCCYHCGWPFPYDVPHQTLCQACATKRPVFEKVRSALIYDGVARKLILELKHGDATHLATLMTGWMMQSGVSIISGANALIPIPLHWRRLLKRGYNQSTLLTQGIHSKTGLPIQSGWLKRSKSTPTQGSLTRIQRQTNVKNAFEVPSAAKQHLKGQVVILVDDVYTTGATLESASKTLLKAGAKEVRALTVARVLKPADLS